MMIILHVAAVAVTAIISIGVLMVSPELTADATKDLSAPKDSAASAHTVVIRVAAVTTTLPISSYIALVSTLFFWIMSLLPFAKPAIAAASFVRESAACKLAVLNLISSFFFFLHDLKKSVTGLPLSHPFTWLKSICASKSWQSEGEHWENLISLGFLLENVVETEDPKSRWNRMADPLLPFCYCWLQGLCSPFVHSVPLSIALHDLLCYSCHLQQVEGPVSTRTKVQF